MGMDLSSLFALPDRLEVAEISLIGSVLTLSLVASAPTAMCPLCGQTSQHRRSSYTRHVTGSHAVFPMGCLSFAAKDAVDLIPTQLM